MKKISAVIAAAGLGTRLKDYKDNSHTKVLIKIRQSSMISEQIVVESWEQAQSIWWNSPPHFLSHIEVLDKKETKGFK